MPIDFFKEIVSRFNEIGAIAPSSKCLARRMTSEIVPKEQMVVIELGPGSGIFTRAILEKLPLTGQLIAVEINQRLAEQLKTNIPDPRLKVIVGNATTLGKYLLENGTKKADYVISGLPLGNFAKEESAAVLREIKNILSENGLYFQFQYFLANLGQVKKFFPNVSLSFELFNIPPAFVYKCSNKTKEAF